MAVLLLTNRYDLHSWALRWGLSRVGVGVDVLITRDLPEGERLCLSLSGDGHATFEGEGFSLLNEYTSVWLRRVEEPKRVSTRLAVDNQEMVLHQSKLFLENILQHLGRVCTVINDVNNKPAASAKFHQLSVAREVGFSIPETIMTNDPIRVRQFFFAHNGNVIYKPFQLSTFIVLTGGEVRTEKTFTTTVDMETLNADDAAFTSCPGIYQVRIPKCSELRVTFFGNTFFVVRIFSQDEERSSIDFRAGAKPRMEAAVLGGGTLEKCRAFVRKLGLLHGTLDLIETPDGRVIFLEVNERAQFLFVEEAVPAMRMLAAAVAFAQSPSPYFVFCETDTPLITYQEFLGSADYAEFLIEWEMYERQDVAPYTYLVS